MIVATRVELLTFSCIFFKIIPAVFITGQGLKLVARGNFSLHWWEKLRWCWFRSCLHLSLSADLEIDARLKPALLSISCLLY